MKNVQKVLWMEGMFLRPHHFQQAEEYLEDCHRRLRQGAYIWGFSSLSVDESLLAFGKVALAGAEGLFPDGTAFHFSGADAAPAVMDIRADQGGAIILLALPITRAGRESVTFTDSADSLARYLGVEKEVIDTNALSTGSAMVYCGKLRLRLMPESELNGEWLSLGAVRIKTVHQDGSVTLDPDYIPPLLNSRASTVLQGFKQELAGLLRQRRRQLSRYIQQCDGNREIYRDFMLQSLIHRFSAELDHVSALPSVHPERLFAHWLSMALELTVCHPPYYFDGDIPRYNHRDAGRCFSNLMLKLRQGLFIAREEYAISLPLTNQMPGLSVATLPHPEMVRNFDFILAVQGDFGSDEQFAHFLAQIKIAPTGRINDVVQLQLPGISLNVMTQAPKQLVGLHGWQYIALDNHGPLWPEIEKTGAFAFYLGGEFSDRALAFWAVRRRSSVGDGGK
ncbi:type VI secretion system baseplate subunit TssK [Sodalis ligni]|uniref:type VI secretion system baseplate subunit TssK n=1 Tax=Sodalis ligni TaxID=2697027 RepID=UPI00193EC950|nr:type VI secretion system baseplate subunit TssK [Sodalis ligni]QWA11542.1 type VI secretion system baseplate subunit TssK [Sodalis ligni]